MFLGRALILPISPFFIMVVAAPLTPQTPWDTPTRTSFGAMVYTVSRKLVLRVLPSWKVPSAAWEKLLSTFVRPGPHAVVFTPSPNYPLPSMAIAPMAYPSETLSALSATQFSGYSLPVTTTRPMGRSFFVLPCTAAAASSGR